MSDSLFPDLQEGALTGKTVASINHSRNEHNRLLLAFGGYENLPCSVMKAKRPKEILSLKDRGYDATQRYAMQARDDRKLRAMRDAFTISGRGGTIVQTLANEPESVRLAKRACAVNATVKTKTRQRRAALSTFPQNIGRSMVLFYSEPGQTIFDPFAGHNSRMELCIRAGRNYIGCDLSTRFMKHNRQVAKRLAKDFPKLTTELHHTDSRNCPVDDEVGDFTLTSPPYYDIEYYGDEPEQLGDAPTYEGFLKGIKKVLRENFRCLKPGAFAVWFINDFRRKQKFIPYHADLMRVGQEVGFDLADIIIVDLGHSIRECFVVQTMRTKIIPKRHEYGVVFRKPTKKS